MSKLVDARLEIPTTPQNFGPAPPSITLDNITHYFGPRCVFRKVSASVSAGQILVVSGSNGSGKSTLLRIIAGLLTASEGSAAVAVDGKDLDESARRPHIGYVAPDLVLYRELTGVENLEFFAELHGVRLDRSALIDLLTRVGLRGRGRDLVGGYSSGMRQRLKYAFALAHSPPILLLDEPTANLDVDGIQIVESIVEAQQRRPEGGLTIVATNEVRELAWSPLRVVLDRQP